MPWSSIRNPLRVKNFMRRLMIRVAKTWSYSAVGAPTAWNTGTPSVVR